MSTATISTDLPATASVEAARGLLLASQVGKGDATAEGELVRHYERGVLTILIRLTGDRELSRDLCQDTFVVVLKRLRSSPLEDPSRLAAFIAQTARNLAIAEQRRNSRRRTDSDSEAITQVADNTPSREEASAADSAAAAVRKLLRDLKSERDRAAIVRYYLNEESKETICADLGLTEIQFNLVLFRARDRMRQLIEQQGFSRGDLLSIVVF